MDASLSEQGKRYAKVMGETLMRHRQEERQALIAQGGSDAPLKPLTVWTSTRRRTVETASYLQGYGFQVRQRSQLSRLNPGVCERMSEDAIRELYPEEVAKHEADPYHHRYPRAEVRKRRTQLAAVMALLTSSSHIMTSPSAWSRSSSSSSASNTIYSSSLTKASCGSSTDISWPAMPPRSQT